MTEPYVPKPRDFRGLTQTDGLYVNINIEEDDGVRRPWIECYGLSFSEKQTAVWSFTDVKYGHDSHAKSFHIPLVGFRFCWWSGGTIWMEAYVKPRLHFERIGLLPTGFEHDKEMQANYDGRMEEDRELSRYLLGRKLIFATSAAGHPRKKRKT